MERKIFVCPSVCLSVRPSVCLSICLSVRLSVRLSVCLSVCLSVRPSVRPSVCLSVRPSICLSVRLSVRLYVFLSVHLSVRPSVCPSVCLVYCLSLTQGPFHACLCIFSHIFFPSYLFLLRNLRMPRWRDITRSALGHRDIHHGQGTFIKWKINAWEVSSVGAKGQMFSPSFRVRNYAKSSRCCRGSLLTRCTADTGTVPRGSMCGSVWIRARTTWKEK